MCVYIYRFIFVFIYLIYFLCIILAFMLLCAPAYGKHPRDGYRHTLTRESTFVTWSRILLTRISRYLERYLTTIRPYRSQICAALVAVLITPTEYTIGNSRAAVVFVVPSAWINRRACFPHPIPLSNSISKQETIRAPHDAVIHVELTFTGVPWIVRRTCIRSA